MRVLLLLSLVFLLSCGRPLTPAEKSFAKQMHGPEINVSRIRMVPGAPLGAVTMERPKRPRLTCRERILPEPTTDTITYSPAAMVLHNKVFISNVWYQENYLREYPGRFDLVMAMLFAHEITHVWQWQNRRKTGYSPFRAAREHSNSIDPYLFDLSTRPNLLDYPYEQQASIVEEYVCCATLDPDAPRTKHLKKMLSAAFPMQKLHIPKEVYLPWDGVQVEGICDPDRGDE